MRPYFHKIDNVVTDESKQAITDWVYANKDKFSPVPGGASRWWNLNLPDESIRTFLKQFVPEGIDCEAVVQVNWKGQGGLSVHKDGNPNDRVNKQLHTSALTRNTVIAFPISDYFPPTYFYDVIELKNTVDIKLAAICDYDNNGAAIINVVNQFHRIADPKQDRIVLQLNIPYEFDQTIQLWETLKIKQI